MLFAMNMLKSTMRDWFMEHPEALTLSFFIALKFWQLEASGFVSPSDASAYNGP